MRPINRCLNPKLLEICQKTIQLDQLNDKLKQLLAPSLAEHCQVGSFNKGCLLITASNAVWATELRYSLPTLRDRLRKEVGLYQLTSIKINIALSNQHSCSTKPRHPLVLSATARHSIEAASEICKYQPLKKALHKLANNKP